MIYSLRSFSPYSHLSPKTINHLRRCSGLNPNVRHKGRNFFELIVCSTGFRPCIDIHKGKVKQIIGSSLKDNNEDYSSLITNYESTMSASQFAELYKQHGITGGHVIMLDAGEESKYAAMKALQSFPGGLQVGGGINAKNASTYIEVGASHVIVTSYIFIDGKLILDRLKDLVYAVGKERLVLDLSCRKKNGKYAIVTNRWQKFTDVFLDESIDHFAKYADELLIHGVDVEGKRLGIDEELVALLGRLSTIPVTYAGGVTTMEDLELIKCIGMGHVDVTVGSSLDIFGGNLPLKDVVEWHNKNKMIHS